MARDELEQVILNLVVNARDACRPGGRIEVVVREPVKDDDLPPDRLVLEVIDDGTGMDERTRAHLFEPYFTTKPGGTGLGLAIVYNVARRAGGTVQVASEPGTGSVDPGRAAPPSGRAMISGRRRRIGYRRSRRCGRSRPRRRRPRRCTPAGWCWSCWPSPCRWACWAA